MRKLQKKERALAGCTFFNEFDTDLFCATHQSLLKCTKQVPVLYTAGLQTYSSFYTYYKRLVRSPWSDQKVSQRAGHNSVALPTAEGRREGDRICPALRETFKSLQGDLHSMGWRHMGLFWWGGVKSPPGGAADILIFCQQKVTAN